MRQSVLTVLEYKWPIHFLTKLITNFDVLLTVRLSIILVINKLNAQILVLQ